MNISLNSANILKKIGAYTAYIAKWIVYLGRKYPILAAVHIALSVYLLFFWGRQPNLPPPVPSTTAPLAPAPTLAPAHNQTPAATTPITPPASTPDQVTQIAQARAFKDGGELTIRWNQDVEQPKLYADNRQLKAECESRSCTVAVEEGVQQLQAKWEQQGQPFEKVFRF